MSNVIHLLDDGFVKRTDFICTHPDHDKSPYDTDALTGCPECGAGRCIKHLDGPHEMGCSYYVAPKEKNDD
jgi:hypothetical protein